MESGSLYVSGGAMKASYQIYDNLKKNSDYHIEVLGAFSRIDKDLKPITKEHVLNSNYDLIFMNSIRDVLIVDRYMKRHPNTKVVYSDRGNVIVNHNKAGIKGILLPKMIARQDLLRRMKRWLTCYVAITAEQDEHAKRYFESSIKCLYIPIAPDKRYKKTNAKKTFDGAITSGRLDERQKKLSFLIKAIKKLVSEKSELSDKLILKVTSTGPDEQRYKKLVEKLELHKNIVFTGYISEDDLVKAFNDSQFFVSVSVWESPGRAFLEAMSCGLPVLNNSSNNSAGFIKNGENGVVYEYDNIDDFVEKFYFLYTNTKYRERTRLSFPVAFSYAAMRSLMLFIGISESDLTDFTRSLVHILSTITIFASFLTPRCNASGHPMYPSAPNTIMLSFLSVTLTTISSVDSLYVRYLY
ncbi:MAG: glycosyltransferase family 4 protein, partial [Candidatus Micrarchaeales archaeon]